MGAEIVNIFKKLAHEHNKCVIVVTHSAAVAAQSDVVFKMHNSKLAFVPKDTVLPTHTASSASWLVEE
jgi:ABC-type lipoprotein export system ATPase subunit